MDPDDGWCDDDESDCNTLRSDGPQPSSDEDAEFDENGNYRNIGDDLQPSSDEDAEFDEYGNYRTIEEDYSAVGQGDFSLSGDPEPQDAYMDLVALKRRRLEGGGVA